MKSYILILVLLLFILSSINNIYSSVAFEDTYPIALSKSNGDVYALYNDGSLYRLDGDGTILVAKIPLTEITANLLDYVVDFSLGPHLVFINLYRSMGQRFGENIVLVYDLISNKFLLNKRFSFNITSKGFSGKLVVSVVPSNSSLGIVLVDSTRGPLIKVYVFNNNSHNVLSYNATLTFFTYVYNDSLIAPIPSRIKYENNILNAGSVIDVVNNKTMFTLPSIAPIFKIAKVIVQPYRVRSEWIAYVTVIGGLINNTEFYIVKPNSIRLEEYHRVVVDPFLRFAVILYGNDTSSVLFNDGVALNISHQLSIIPQNYYFYNEPISGILDVDKNSHLVLYRVVDGDNIYIVLVSGNKIVKVASTSINNGLKIHGFYAYINGGKVYLLNTTTHEIKTISIVEPKQDSRGTFYLLLIVIVLVVILASTSRILSKRILGR